AVLPYDGSYIAQPRRSAAPLSRRHRWSAPDDRAGRRAKDAMARAITPEAVMAEAERVMLRPFEWGPCDCCSAACNVFASLWGVDPMAPVRGYSGPLGAARL